MRYRSYESSSPKKIMTYFFYVVCAFWVLVTAILGYQFLNENWEVIDQKWWTFVEAIFDQISYLPYLKNDWQSVFYQSFLFDSCIDYRTLNEEGLEGTNCKIITQDYQTYYVSVEGTWKKRSDEQPWTINDVYFTYEKIIHQNVWDIKTLNAYKDLKIEPEEWRIKITFPTSTTDNNYFFTYFILPKHILESAQYWDYIGVFASSPITSACWKLQPRTSDPQSLIFNLMNCDDTNLAYYQIKNYPDFESFSKSVIEENNTIVDMYAHQLQLWDYARKNIIKSDILSFFFNTKSPKMKVRLRRALGWLINAKFYVWDEYWKFLKMYREPLLTTFYSNWENIKEFINRVSLTEKDEGVWQQELEDSWVQALKTPISINWVERKFVFYTPKREDNINLEIKFSNQFENIKITDTKGHSFSPTNYKKTDKKVTYPLEIWKNLNNGLNQYTIVWTIKDKTYTIANIDLYMIEIEQNQWQEAINEENNWKISVVYYNNLESNFAVKQFKKILEDAWIIDNFTFTQVSSPEALEAKLVMGDYDIILNTINIGMKKDILRILTTSEATINPSKYTNPNLTNLFKQYTKASKKDEIAEQINQIFAQDMPFVIVWYPYDFVNLRENLMKSAFWTDEFMYEYNRRYHLLKHITLLQSKRIDIRQLKNIKGFINHLMNTIDYSLNNQTTETEQETGTWSTENNTEGTQETVEETTNEIDNNTQEENPESNQEVTTVPTDYNSWNPFEGLLQPAQ